MYTSQKVNFCPTCPDISSLKEKLQKNFSPSCIHNNFSVCPCFMYGFQVRSPQYKCTGFLYYILKCYLYSILQDSPLVLQSDRNVTVNARNQNGHLTGQMVVGEFYVNLYFKPFSEENTVHYYLMKMRRAAWHWTYIRGVEQTLSYSLQTMHRWFSL